MGIVQSDTKDFYNVSASGSSESLVWLGPDDPDHESEVLRLEFETKVLAGPISPSQSAEIFEDLTNEKRNRNGGVPWWDRIWSKMTKCSTNTRTDYARANYLNSIFQQRHLIATEAPTADTVCDFFDMIRREKCRVVVVLGKMFDDESYAYWSPDLGVKRNGRWVVGTSKKRDMGDFKIYTLMIIDPTSMKKCRTITLFHYVNWTEHKALVNTDNVFEMMRAICIKEGPRLFLDMRTKRPIVVHCNDDSGRTGTFCTIFLCLCEFLWFGDTNVLDMVKRLRYGRYTIVKTPEQYVFIFHVLNTYFFTL
uniref:AsIV-cont00036-ORF1 n=1 Tax=Apophua simplicipes ichnovirus TaxID=1329648 RepID=S5DSZ1_9VIRU|nr:AsIV-cont00036-ORF1 [Apophua simplicipes ichnovirus]